jgi:plastocyanin
MRRVVIPCSLAIVCVTSVWFAACTGSSSPAVPAGPAPVSSLPGDNPPTPADSGAPDSGAPDSGAPDSGSCAPDAGSAVTAKFDFAATKVLDGGKGQLLSIHTCDTVTWINDDNGTPHGVVSVGGGFSFSTSTVTGTDAGVPMTPVQFPVPGTFGYQCAVHGPMMSGEISVQ